MNGRVHRRLPPAVAVVAALLLAACSRGGGTEVDVQTVERAASTRRITADGTLQPVRQAQVAPTVSGTVSQVYVQDGQQVNAGTLLFTIDDADLQDQLNAVESASGGGGGGAKLKAPDTSDFDKAMAELLTETNDTIGMLRALEPTVAAGFTAFLETIITTQQVQNAFNMQLYMGLIKTMQAGDFAQAQAFAALGGGGGSNTQALAQAQDLRRQIDATQVDAPINGTVSLQSSAGSGLGSSMAGAASLTAASSVSTPGEIQADSLVAAGQTVMTIYDLSGTQVRALVDETDVPAVAKGQAVDVQVDAFPDVDLNGTVAEIAVSPTTAEGGGNAYVVLVDVPADRINGWRPGMTASVDIQIERARTGIEVPATAVLTKAGKDYVFKIEDGKAVRTPIDKQSGGEGVVLVTKGLQPGDKIATSGVSDLDSGEAVSAR